MFYITTQTRTVIEEKWIKPSDVYSNVGTRAMDNISALMPTWNIINFRPPLDGEQFISAPMGESVLSCSSDRHPAEPRFIVNRRQGINEVWE